MAAAGLPTRERVATANLRTTHVEHSVSSPRDVSVIGRPCLVVSRRAGCLQRIAAPINEWPLAADGRRSIRPRRRRRRRPLARLLWLRAIGGPKRSINASRRGVFSADRLGPPFRDRISFSLPVVVVRPSTSHVGGRRVHHGREHRFGWRTVDVIHVRIAASFAQ